MAGDDSYISSSEPRRNRSRDHESTTMKRKRRDHESTTMKRKRRHSGSPPPTHSSNSNHKRRRRSRPTYLNSPPRHRSPRSMPQPYPPIDPEMYEDEEYRQANINMKKLQFFEEHSAYEWLRDIYDPSRETCIQQSKEMLEAVVSDDLDRNYVDRVPCEKYGTRYSCRAEGCVEGFTEPDILQTHLKEKHPELVRELREKASDAVFFQSYMNDRNAPYPEQESDLPCPPPVLMPIVGAGPLGPFVPAPFEITMNVLGQSNPNSSIFVPGRHRRSRQRYVDLDAPQKGSTIVHYRTLH